MLWLGSVVYVALLLINAVAILNHERFLVPLGFHSGHVGANSNQNNYDPYSASGVSGGADGASIKARAVALVGAVRTLMRIPLIPINIVVILYELILG